MSERTIVQALNNALFLAMKKDRDVILLGQDIGIDGGVFRITEGLLEKFSERRVIDTGIAEAAIVGMSLGMSLNGLKPIAEIQFAGFIYPAFQQLIAHVARFRNRSRGLYSAPIVIRAPYGGGVNAIEMHSESLEALFAHIPGLKVVIPSNPYNAKGLLLASINDPDPVLFLEPLKLYRAFKQDIPDDYYEVSLEKANILSKGSDVTIIAWGAMMPIAKEASSKINASCEIIDLQTINPWDKKTVIESVKKTGRAVIIHEATKTAGFGAEIAASIQEECMLLLKAPIFRVTAPDVIVPYYRAENFYRPNAEILIKKLNEVLGY